VGLWAVTAILSAALVYYGAAVFAADAHTYKAGLARDRGDAEGFLRENHAALKAYPYATRPTYWLGISYLDAGYPEDAMTALRQYERRYPHANRIDYELGRAQLALHHCGASIQSYRAAVKMEPDNFQAWLGLAIAYSAIGKSELADKAASRAVSLGSQAQTAYYYNSAPLRTKPGLARYLVASGLLRAGFYGEAVAELRKAVEESPGSVDYLTVLGAVYLQLERTASSNQAVSSLRNDAEKTLRSAISIDDKAIDAHGYLASVYLEDGRKSEARVELEKAISLTSDQNRLATFRQMLSQTE